MDSKMYSNIHGTTKASFRIGNRGIIIEPEALYEYDDEGNLLYEDDGVTPKKKEDASTIAIQKVGSKTRYILHNGIIRDVRKNSEDGTTTFYFYDEEREPLTIRNIVFEGGAAIYGTYKENEIAVFHKENTGQIKSSGMTISSKISANSNNTVPTAEAVMEYVGVVEKPLSLALNGNLPTEQHPTKEIE